MITIHKYLVEYLVSFINESQLPYTVNNVIVNKLFNTIFYLPFEHTKKFIFNCPFILYLQVFDWFKLVDLVTVENPKFYLVIKFFL